MIMARTVFSQRGSGVCNRLWDEREVGSHGVDLSQIDIKFIQQGWRFIEESDVHFNRGVSFTGWARSGDTS